MNTSPNGPTDWEAIEREYRAGQLSNREIGRQYGVSDTAIRKKAKDKAWTRALASKVREAVVETLVRDPGSQDGSHQGSQDSQARSDAEIVKVAAERGAAVVRRHQNRLARAGSVVDKLLEDLEGAQMARVEIEKTIEAEHKDPKEAKARNQMLRAVSLQGHAQTAVSLAGALRHLIPLERKAFNLDAGVDEAEVETPLTKLREQISGTAFRPVEMPDQSDA
jgi:hypothetical protein